jgi:hypothetical protein
VFSHKIFWSIFVNQKYDESYLSPAMDLKSPRHFYPTSCCGPQQQNCGVVHVDKNHSDSPFSKCWHRQLGGEKSP